MLKKVKILWAVWTAVNGVLLALIFIRGTTQEDIRYYFRGVNPDAPVSLQGETDAGSMALRYGEQPLNEYPDAGVWPLRLLDVFTGDSEGTFTNLFPIMCVALSGLFMWFLLRWGARHGADAMDAADPGVAAPSAHPAHFRAAWYWVFFSACAGPIMLTRMDLIPGIGVAVALAFVLTRPRVASFILAYASLAKLWPAVLASSLVGRFTARSTWVRLLSYFASLILLAGVTVVTLGMDRLLSPISYQDVRGLQIESVFATPFMVARLFDTDAWTVDYARSKSFEVTGPGVELAMLCATVLLAAMLVFAVGFALWRFLKSGSAARRGDTWTHESAVLFALLLVALLIVTNKVFSPQYIAWLGPLIAVATIVYRAPSMRLIRWCSVLIATLTTVIYPLTYDLIVAGESIVPLLVLMLRNVGMVVLAVLVARALFSSVREHSEHHQLRSVAASS